MDEFWESESRLEHYRYQTKLEKIKKRISEMSEEQIEKVLSLAKGSNDFDITALSEEDKLMMSEICDIDINKTISTMSEDEMRSRCKELWDKTIKYGKSRKDNEPLTVYENNLLICLEAYISRLDDKGKEPEKISES